MLALGNDILGDDAVGLAAARALRAELAGVQPPVEVIEAPGAGFTLLELLEGYDRALLLDAAVTGRCPPGTVLELPAEQLGDTVAPSPHAAALAEVLDLARRLQAPFPAELRILALEVEDPYVFREGLSAPAAAALPAFIARARQILQQWRNDAR